ncbi:MAG: YjjG family noncanonical pyrimidine nucleotidase [Caryophanon sp.]|nr:YjjG family noncanonical pyrimidine nucleotidase [Caryophanon sp.]
MKKQYTTLLFDVDDTLLDFDAAEAVALPLVCEEFGLTYSEQVRAYYRDINEELWRALELGQVTRDELLSSRFARLFQAFGQSVDGQMADARYRDYLVVGQQFVPEADQVIQTLSKQHDLFIVTNGVTTTQHKRLEHAGMKHLFRDIFVSEQTGSQKPMRAFFDYAFTRIPQFDATKTLIVGDSFGADIVGGYNAGIDTCWLNAKGKPKTADIPVTYEIKALRELYRILNIPQIV